jgi:hypothetical protein
MAMLDNLTTQVNLAWDETELESISDQVEGFDPGDFGFEAMPEPSDMDVESFFEDMQNTDHKDKGFKIGLMCPTELMEQRDTIIAKVREAIAEYEGIKIIS